MGMARTRFTLATLAALSAGPAVADLRSDAAEVLAFVRENDCALRFLDAPDTRPAEMSGERFDAAVQALTDTGILLPKGLDLVLSEEACARSAAPAPAPAPSPAEPGAKPRRAQTPAPAPAPEPAPAPTPAPSPAPTPPLTMPLPVPTAPGTPTGDIPGFMVATGNPEYLALCEGVAKGVGEFGAMIPRMGPDGPSALDEENFVEDMLTLGMMTQGRHAPDLIQQWDVMSAMVSLSFSCIMTAADCEREKQVLKFNPATIGDELMAACRKDYEGAP